MHVIFKCVASPVVHFTRSTRAKMNPGSTLLVGCEEGYIACRKSCSSNPKHFPRMTSGRLGLTHRIIRQLKTSRQTERPTSSFCRHMICYDSCYTTHKPCMTAVTTGHHDRLSVVVAIKHKAFCSNRCHVGSCCGSCHNGPSKHGLLWSFNLRTNYFASVMTSCTAPL